MFELQLWITLGSQIIGRVNCIKMASWGQSYKGIYTLGKKNHMHILKSDKICKKKIISEF